MSQLELKEPKARQSKRLQLEFSQEAYERLEKFKLEKQAGSFAELIRDALRIYYWINEQEKLGSEFALVKGDTVQTVKLIV